MKFQIPLCMRIVLAAGVLGCMFPRPAAAQQTPDSAAVAPNPLEAVVVSATRSEQSLGSLPYAVHVIGAPAIAATPSATVADLLRNVAGFTTRDYQSAYVTGPSASIPAFRGLGGSSAGRVLVLLDGIPMGDPFSGWLDWARIPLPMLASAEVIRGGGSIVWGSRALGGVVNLRTVQPRRTEVSMLFEGGTFDTRHGAGSASFRNGKLSGILAADYADTDGYILIAPHQAGPVDQTKAMRSGVVAGKVAYELTPRLQGWIGGSSFVGGERPWGTGDKQNFDEARAGGRWLTQANGILTFATFANRRDGRNRSFNINTARTTKSPQRFSDSPAHSEGLNVQWTKVLMQSHEVSTGVDFTSAHGTIAEAFAFSGDSATRERDAGGSQQFAGIFVQDAADLWGAVRMLASLRLDRVSSSDGRRTLRTLPARNVLSDSTIAGTTDTRLTYSLGLRRQQASWLGLRANVYEAFRAPSMYEMYHPRFSTRGGVTEANSALEAERLRGAEAGVDISVGRTALARVTGFTNSVVSPIMDITIGTAGSQPEVIAPCGLMPAGQTCAQRQNVPRLRSDGVEAEFSWDPSPAWHFGSGYSYSNTRVRAPGEPADGKRAIRTAPHTVVSRIAFDRPRWISAAVEARYVGPRFEDDLNTIELEKFYLVGLRVNRAIGSRINAHVKIENLLDEEFEVTRARSGLAEMGAKRWVTVGLRTTW